jgi:hypothetical protein
MATMNLAPFKWDLHPDVCPCDVHMNEWIEAKGIAGKAIYHFGSGNHHVIGRRQAANGSGNAVFAITASKEEHDAYAALVSADARLARSYLCYFGDVYLGNAMLLPRFDVVTMFHLCEFFDASTVSADYGGLDDRGLLDLMTERLQPGGYMLFYEGSRDFAAAKPIIAAWERAQPVRPDGTFKTLIVYRKNS